MKRKNWKWKKRKRKTVGGSRDSRFAIEISREDPKNKKPFQKREILTEEETDVAALDVKGKRSLNAIYRLRNDSKIKKQKNI